MLVVRQTREERGSEHGRNHDKIKHRDETGVGWPWRREPGIRWGVTQGPELPIGPEASAVRGSGRENSKRKGPGAGMSLVHRGMEVCAVRMWPARGGGKAMTRESESRN